MTLTYAELFAGCGGMSLGLDSRGFKRLFANELSPMAAETYAYNFLASDLSDPSFAETPVADRQVLWLQSAYKATNIKGRLNENPHTFQDHPFLDELTQANDLRGRLVVGDIRQLNACADLNGPLIPERPDIVSGGPPCQSFSMAGLRQYSNQRNRLPGEFAAFVAHHQPRLVVLENVSGILRPFREDGHSLYAWFEVAKAFAAIGYVPICLHVNAALVGVAQNRTRFLMIAVREDELPAVRHSLGPEADDVLALGEKLLQAEGDIDWEPKYRVHDLTDAASSAPAVLREYFVRDSRQLPARAAFESTSDYVKGLEEEFGQVLHHPSTWSGGTSNTDLRGHTPPVKARFRAYQIAERLARTEARTSRSMIEVIKQRQNVTTLSERMLEQIIGVDGLPLLDRDLYEVTNTARARAVLVELGTKKHSQRALNPDKPAPAALSIPDDACHWQDLRTMSVREMARIQSFPDSFVFRSVPTTGGARRKFQVPQYTQVGNAVPPRLAAALGVFAERLLNPPA